MESYTSNQWKMFINEKLEEKNLRFLVELGENARHYLANLVFVDYDVEPTGSNYLFNTRISFNGTDVPVTARITENMVGAALSGEAETILGFSSEEIKIVLELFKEFGVFVNPMDIRMGERRNTISQIERDWENYDVQGTFNPIYIEFSLSRIPLPEVYLQELKNGYTFKGIGKTDVIYTLVSYVQEKYSFSARNQHFSFLNGKKFSELEGKYKIRIHQATINLHIVDSRSPIGAENIIKAALKQYI